MSPPLGQGPRESPEQYRARKALEKVEQHRRLRIAIASRFIAERGPLNLHEDLTPESEVAMRAAFARALRLAEMLVDEGSK